MTALIAFFLFALSSCGSITTRDKYISIDSNPRGLEVRNDKDQVIGSTPTILPRPKRKAQLYLGQERHQFKQECSIDWKHSVIPNAVMTYAVPVLGAAFYTIDWFNDEFKACQTHYTLSLSEKGSSQEKRFLIIPSPLITSSDEHLIEDHLRSKLSGEIISYKKGYREFAYFNLLKSFDQKKTPQEILLKIGHDLRPTHLVSLQEHDGKLNYTVSDYFNQEVTEQGTIEFDLSEKKSGGLNSLKLFLKNNIHILPNAIALSMTSLEDEVVNDKSLGKLRLEHHQHANAIEQISHSFTFERLQHPLHQEEYSFSFQTAPSFFSTKTNTKVISLESNQEIFRSELKIYGLSYDASLTFHSPIGAFGLSAGIGQSHWLQESTHGRRTHNSYYYRSGISYTAFMTNRLYLRLVADSYFFSQGYKIGPHESWNHLDTSAIRLGYYFPELSDGIF